MGDALRYALTVLTVAPVRGPASPDRSTAGRGLALAPLVGLVLGLLAGAVVVAGDAAASPLVGAALGVALLAVLTRGLHLDGLADLTDGLASYRDPAGARAVMRSPEVGPLGAAAVVLVLIVQAAALATAAVHGRALATAALAVAAGRLAVTAACTSTPAARTEGLGAGVAQTVRRGTTAGWALVLAAGGAGYDVAVRGSVLPQAVLPALAVSAGLLAARALRGHAVRRTGGLTGDALGALCETATTATLVVLAARGWS